VRVQEDSAETELRQLRIEFRVPIPFISSDRVTHVGCVRSDLVGPPRDDGNLHQSGTRTIILDDAKLTSGRLTRLTHAHEALAVALPPGQQRCVDLNAAVLPGSAQQRQIALFHPAVPEQAVQPPQRTPSLRYQQATRRSAVQAMDEIQGR